MFSVLLKPRASGGMAGVFPASACQLTRRGLARAAARGRGEGAVAADAQMARPADPVGPSAR